MRKKIGCLAAVLAIALFIWAYIAPYKLHAIYLPKNKVYQNNIIDKRDFRIYAVSRLGRRIKVEDFYLNSDMVSKTGLVSITSTRPHLGAVVNLESIKVKSSDITYNTICYEDQTEQYQPNVTEILTFEDGKTEKIPASEIDSSFQIDQASSKVKIQAEGQNDSYVREVSMILIDSITTDDKVSILEPIQSDGLNLKIHYSDGTEVVVDKMKIRSEKILKPVKGVNLLQCYYQNKSYVVKVNGFDPDEGKPKATFPGYGSFILQYSKPYYVEGADRLNKSAGVRYFYNHRETFYTLREAGGISTSLYIPGKHIAEDGTVRDQEGYICVAADYRFCKRYEVVLTTLGPGKVYDTGCRYGTVDLYVNW